MTDKPSEDSKDPLFNDEGKDSESASNQNDSAANFAAEIDDIDSLLLSATEALEAVDHQLGEAETQTAATAAQSDQVKKGVTVAPSAMKEKPSILSQSAGNADVDNALAKMEEEIGVLSEQVDVSMEETPAAVPGDSANSHPKQENVSEGKEEEEGENPDEAAAPEDTENPEAITEEQSDEAAADDPILDILENLPDVESEAAPEDTSDSSESSDSEPEGGVSIDDVLSAMAEELGGEPDEDDPVEDTVTAEKPPEIASEDEQKADKEADSVLADLEQEIEAVSGAEETPAPADESRKKPQAQSVTEDEQIVAAEIAAKEASGSDQEVTDESAPKPDYDHFPPPVRLLLKTTDGVNKTFFFLPDSARDTLGLVAVITLMLSMIAAVVILFCS